MAEQPHVFSLDELVDLAELPRRTIRYYIQIGLLDRPEGAGRGAHYTSRHLEQLLEIRKWQNAGVSLERIRGLLHGDAEETAIPPLPPRQRGSLAVCSHLNIDDGIELVIEPGRTGLSPEEVRALATGVMELYAKLKSSRE